MTAERGCGGSSSHSGTMLVRERMMRVGRSVRDVVVVVVVRRKELRGTV